MHGFTTPFSFPPTAHLVLGRDAYGSHGPHCRLKGRVRTVLRQEISQTLSNPPIRPTSLLNQPIF